MTASTASLRAHQFAGLEPGPRLIVTGAVHGNETCGTQAITRILGELECGEIVVRRGLLTLIPVCNPLAYARGTRFGERNLNRRLQPNAAPVQYEDGIANVLCPWLAAHDALLDLHSFRSPGRPFALRGPQDNAGALEPFARAAEESALVAHLGVDRVVEGWMQAYAGGVAARRARMAAEGQGEAAAIEDPAYGIGTTEYMRSQGGYGVTLECGQHDDPAAPEVAYRAIRQAIALLGLADLALAPATPPAERLRLSSVVDRLAAGDRFVRAWTSFDALRAGETIALREDGSTLRAPYDGWIVFPDVNAAPGHEWYYLAVASERPA